ncbi:SMI1/KNR4 family protein [Gordonia sp. NPDC003504]
MRDARADIAPTDTAVVTGNISRSAYGMNGVREPGFASVRVGTELLGPLADSLDKGEDFGYQATVSPDGDAEILLVDLTSPAIANMSPNGDIMGVLFDPDALPCPYLLVPESMSTTPSPGADPASLTDMVRRALPDATPASDAAIATAEKEFGRALPAEIVALYRAVGSGDLAFRPGGIPFDLNGDREGEEDAYGLHICALDSTDRDYCTAANRAISWAFSATEVVRPDPTERVQPLAHSSAWFPIADNWGGSYYVVDLAPGPRGTVGQLLFIHRDTNSGARWVAPSLTEFFLHGWSSPGTDETGTGETGTGERDTGESTRAPVQEVVASARSGLTLSAVTSDTEVLRVFDLDEPVDLTVLAGHPTLRTLILGPDSVTGMAQTLGALPALEYLSLPYPTWLELVADDAVPSIPVAFEFRDAPGDLIPPIALANTLLRMRGLDAVEVTRVRGSGIDTFVPTVT